MIDEEGFEAAMAEQRDRARAASKFAASADGAIRIEAESEFS